MFSTFTIKSLQNNMSNAIGKLNLKKNLDYNLTVNSCESWEFLVACAENISHQKWKNFAEQDSCITVHTATCLERKVAGRENWFQLLELLAGDFHTCCG